jgi:hypothetical protein
MLSILCKVSALNKLCKLTDILLEKYGIVEQLLVAFVAEDSRLVFDVPRALVEYLLPLSALAVAGASEEPLSNIVML